MKKLQNLYENKYEKKRKIAKNYINYSKGRKL